MTGAEKPKPKPKQAKEGDNDREEEKTKNSSHILFRDSTDPETFHDAVWGGVFNRRRDPSRAPFAVVQAACLEHVKEGVRLAVSAADATATAQQQTRSEKSENSSGKSKIRISVRSGGHSWPAWSVRHDAVLIDLKNFRHVVYDEDTKVVTCSPSLTGEELNTYLANVDGGRMFVGGHCPDIGLGGFLLQGGMGWNCKVCIVTCAWKRKGCCLFRGCGCGCGCG
jgi:hypothetical protein